MSTISSSEKVQIHLRAAPLTLASVWHTGHPCSQEYSARHAGESEVEHFLRLADTIGHTVAGTLTSCVPRWCLKHGWSRLSSCPYPDLSGWDVEWIRTLGSFADILHYCGRDLEVHGSPLERHAHYTYMAGYCVRLIHDIIEDAYFRGEYNHPITPLLVPFYREGGWEGGGILSFVESLYAADSPVRKSSFFRSTANPFYTIYGKDQDTK